ncbi:ABC transporter permease [Actinomycetaceae bacterium MB13-C1-2]|nr:ABC transporter permease [Actinomycetaceae bacterium MB13-C1-2]
MSASEPRADTRTQAELPLDEWVGATYIKGSREGIVEVPSWGLEPVGRRPGFFTYWRQVWKRRAFIWADAKAKAYQNTRGMLLGKIWLIVSPFLNAAVYWIVFGLLLQTSRGIDNFLGYLVIGVNFFPLINSALTGGGNALNGSKNLIRAFSFPRASVLVSWSIRSFLDFIPVAIATMIFVAVLTPASPNWRWFLIIPIVSIVVVFANGLAMLTASLTARLPDLKFIWPLINRFWFYLSGVFFTLSRFEDYFWVSFLMQANPGYVFLSMSRDVLIYQTVPPLSTWIYLATWAVAVWLVGALVFWSREETYGDL